MKSFIVIFLFLAGLQVNGQDSTKLSKFTVEFGTGILFPTDSFNEKAKSGWIGNFSGRVRFSQYWNLGLIIEFGKLVSNEPKNSANVETFAVQHVYLHSRFEKRMNRIVPFVGFAGGVANFSEPDVRIIDGMTHFVIHGTGARTAGYFLEGGIQISPFALIYRYGRLGKSPMNPKYLDNFPVTNVSSHYLSIHLSF